MSASHPVRALQNFPGWPSHAGKEILRLSETIDGVKTRLRKPNIVTHKGDEADGLGPYESLVLKDPDIGVVALVTHTQAPYRGTDVIVDAGTAIDPAIARLKDVLGLSQKDVAWIHPESKMKFGASHRKPAEKKHAVFVSHQAPMTRRSAPTIPLARVAAELAEKTGMTRKDVAGAIDDFVGLVVKHLRKGDKVRIKGLGILQVRNRPARMGRNPTTGEAIKIKASKKVVFRVAKDLKDAV